MSAPVRQSYRARSDGRDQLLEADALIARLQLGCGGAASGVIAVPELLSMVRKARSAGVKVRRWIVAQDETHAIRAWAEVEPSGTDGGCEIVLRDWQATVLPADDQIAADRLAAQLDSAAAEFVAWLDAEQRLLAVVSEADDLQALAEAMTQGIGRPWTHFLQVEGSEHGKPLHWRLLDGVRVSVPGSTRSWRVRLVPQERPGEEPSGFELDLVADQLDAAPPASAEPAAGSSSVSLGLLVGREIAPVLRQPVARIIANAETIRTRLAGPLPEEYAGYAADIAAAGQHLKALLDDLGDLEVVEADDFVTVPDRIDLGEVARQAVGILGLRARAKDISVEVSPEGGSFPAIAEFRRALQIVLNVIGNAIRYSPAGSAIQVRVAQDGANVSVAVSDQGPGLDQADQSRVFEKFERLGRTGDGGSGLGLYISRRLARAMDGELGVTSNPGEGASFILTLPGAA